MFTKQIIKKEVNFKIPTFLKWAGGKKQLLKQIERILPKEINNYHEPFVGGGSLFFFLKKFYKLKKATISDSNKDLINTYLAVRDEVENLINELKEHKKNHSEKYFLRIREEFNNKSEGISRASQLIYLNKSCFNGLYRVNSLGKFNVPSGKRSFLSIDEENLRRASELLKDVKILNQDFKKIVRNVKKKHFIYFDPPYFPLNNTSNFTAYTKENFGLKEQVELARTFRKLSKKHDLMLSNSDVELVRKLYSGFRKEKVQASRMINCNPLKRGKINELLILNYY